MFVKVPAEPFPEDAIDAIVYGCVRDWHGSISAEHGIGLPKKAYLDCSRTPEEIALMPPLRRALDPKGILNPGKIFCTGRPDRSHRGSIAAATREIARPAMRDCPDGRRRSARRESPVPRASRRRPPSSR